MADRPDQLLMRWTPVTDAHGRTRMAAHWVPAEAMPAVAHHAA